MQGQAPTVVVNNTNVDASQQSSSVFQSSNLEEQAAGWTL